MNQATQDHDELLERTLREAGSIGKTWARYGLVAGKNALETSAITLKKVAGLLDDLSSQFKDDGTGGEVVEARGETVGGEPTRKETDGTNDTSDATQH